MSGVGHFRGGAVMIVTGYTGYVPAEAAAIVINVTSATGITFQRGGLPFLLMGAGSGTTATATINGGGLIFPKFAPTASAPAYVKGAMYFDTTLNKLRIGGATAWETVTSA